MKDRVVVITGASSGIGALLAQLVARRGAHPVLVARRADVNGAMSSALARFGHVDVWVNNAGRGITRPVSDLTDDDVDEMMTVNLKSALYGMQAPLPHFRTRGTGHIINVSSMLGRSCVSATRTSTSRRFTPASSRRSLACARSTAAWILASCRARSPPARSRR